SSSRMPATAAIDNETLDHLLSVVDDAPIYVGNHCRTRDFPGQNSGDAAPTGKPPPNVPLCCRQPFGRDQPWMRRCRSVCEGLSPKRLRYSTANRPRWVKPRLAAIEVTFSP